MSHDRTLNFTATDIEREALTHTSATQFDNTGLYQTFNRSSRPVYTFTLKIGPLTKPEVESLSALHAYHMGGKAFLWDGGFWGAVENFQLVSEGDGAKTQYFLPNRNIGAGSLAVQTFRPSNGTTSAWASTAYSLNPGPGVLTFNNSTNTIPASGDDVMARWGCQYRCFFDPAGIKVKEITRRVYEAELRLIETAMPG